MYLITTVIVIKDLVEISWKFLGNFNLNMKFRCTRRQNCNLYKVICDLYVKISKNTSVQLCDL